MTAESGAPALHVVTIFGSSRVRPGDPEYDAAKRLGTLLAEQGWAICNGGHDGTMEAAAWGAREAGGHTIGVSVAMARHANRNAWLDEEIVAESLLARLEKLVTLGEAYLVLPGGIGTLLELVLVWNLVQSAPFSGKPIVVVGTGWADVLATIQSTLPMHPWEAGSLSCVASVEEAVALLVRRLGPDGTGVED